MDLIVGGRMSGKTSIMIDEFLKNNMKGVILCHNESEAVRIRRLLLMRRPYLSDIDLKHFVATWSSVKPSDSRLAYIDNMHYFLEAHLNVVMGTMEVEDLRVLSHRIGGTPWRRNIS